MELSLKCSNIECFNKVYCEKLRKEETRDSVVPDTYPDIAQIVHTSGTVLLRSKDVNNGRARLEGSIPANVLYMGEGDEGLKCLEINLPVSVSCECEDITDECLCCGEIKLLALEARALNPRKVMVRAEISAEIHCYKKDEIAFATQIEDCEAPVYSLEKTTNLSYISAVGEKTFVITDEYPVPLSRPAVDEILSQRTNLQVEDCKVVGNKVVVKGTVKSALLCLGDAGVFAIDFSTVFSQIVDLAEASDGEANVITMLTGAYYELLPDSGGRTINMELHLVAQAEQTSSKEVSLLADAYSNSRVANVETENKIVCCSSGSYTLRETIRETLDMPNDFSEVLDIRALPGCCTAAGEKISVDVNFEAVYKTHMGSIAAINKHLSVSTAFAPEKGETVSGFRAEAGEAYLSAAGGYLELRAPVTIYVDTYKGTELEVITGISIDDEAFPDLGKLPAVTLLKAAGRESLWNIARENCSSVDTIIQVNGIDNDFDYDRFILVPKTF